MDEREGKKRGLISSMLDLFGEEPPDAHRPGYGFAPGAEAPATPEPAAEAEAEAPDGPERADGFRPVTPEQIGQVEPPRLTVVPVDEPLPQVTPAPQEAAGQTAAAQSDTSSMAPLRAALSNLLASPPVADAPAPPSPFADHPSSASAAAEVAAIAAQAARASFAPTPPAPAPVPHVDPATISARVNEMLSSTERLTKDLTAQAEAEAEEIVEHARRQADQQLARARDEATGIVAKARSEAAGIAAAAERAAEETRRVAEEEAEHIRGYARRNASMLVQAAQANRSQVQKSLEQVMSESEFLSKEFVRALGNLISGMRPVIEPIEPELAPPGGSEPGAVA